MNDNDLKTLSDVIHNIDLSITLLDHFNDTANNLAKRAETLEFKYASYTYDSIELIKKHNLCEVHT